MIKTFLLTISTFVIVFLISLIVHLTPDTSLIIDILTITAQLTCIILLILTTLSLGGYLRKAFMCFSIGLSCYTISVIQNILLAKGIPIYNIFKNLTHPDHLFLFLFFAFILLGSIELNQLSKEVGYRNEEESTSDFFGGIIR